MSKPNDKSTATTAPGAATGASDLAVVQPTQTAQTPATAQDPYQGRGGLYTRVNGVRGRVGGTQHPAEAAKAAKATKKEQA